MEIQPSTLRTENAHSGMTPKRALGDALKGVGITSIFIGGVILIPLISSSRSHEWPLYLLFATLPLPLFFLVYCTNRNGRRWERAKAGSHRYHISHALYWAIISAYFVVSGVLHWGPGYHFSIALTFLILSGIHLYRGILAGRYGPDI